MTDQLLTNEEFTALRSIDGSMLQRRPSMEMEVRLRNLGLIHRNGMSRLPVRTAEGNALIKAGQSPDA
jgi:predicted metal-dependent RNase